MEWNYCSTFFVASFPVSFIFSARLNAAVDDTRNDCFRSVMNWHSRLVAMASGGGGGIGAAGFVRLHKTIQLAASQSALCWWVVSVTSLKLPLVCHD